MIKEIRAKVLLSHIKPSEDWFGLRYNMNLYRGCEHQCIYCDSRSACYQIEDFRDVLVKVNAIELLRKELASKRVKGTISTGSMHDPYTPVERKYGLTGQALKVIASLGFPVSIFTKSDLVLKDLDTLCVINRVHASVTISITTTDDDLAKKLEPGAPSVSDRLEAMRTLSARGIHSGVAMMPILPFIEDNEENITRIVERARENGASYIVAWFGMSLRDRQRAYYYDHLDRLFPGLRRRYETRFGDQYQCAADDEVKLANVFNSLCKRYGIATCGPRYRPATANQLSLL